MSRYNVLQAVFMSLYSKKLYRDVARNWGGKSLFYLFFILAISWVGFTAQLQAGMNVTFNTHAQKLFAQVPLLTIKNGVLTTPENRPYLIMHPITNETMVVIDMSGQYKTIDDAHSPVFINQTDIVTKPRPQEMRVNKLPANLNLVIDPQAIYGFLLQFLGYAWLLIYPVLVIASYVYRVLEALLYGIIGKILSLICGAKLSYGQVTQVAMVALTPTIAAATVLDYCGITFSRQFTFYFLLAMAYLLYGVIANIAADEAAKE